MLQKAVSILRQENRDGRADYVFQAPDGTKTTIRLWVGESVMQLPDPVWIVRDFIQRGGLTVIYGVPGSGKSLAMLDWAQHIQLGQPWYGKAVQGGNVLYVMAEGQFGLKGRLEAWSLHHDITVPPVRYHIEGVSFWNPAGKENPASDAIISAAAALEVDVVFIDTMAATFGGGDENRQQDMNLYLRPLRELRQMGIAVVIAHHANRGEGSIRGSTVLTGEADTIIEMRPVFDKDNPGRVQWTNVICRKQKDYVPFPPFRLNLRSVELEPNAYGLPRSAPVFEPPSDRYDGPVDQGGRRAAVGLRQESLAETLVRLVEATPGLSWRKLRDKLSGKNTEKAAVRDRLLAVKVLEYDEAEGGYYLGEVPFENSTEAEIPPLLGLPINEEE